MNLLQNDFITIFMGLAGVIAGTGLILLEVKTPRGERDEATGLRLFRFRVNRWLVGIVGIAVGLLLLVVGPI